MKHPDTVLIRVAALDDRIRELGLKRGWVADQIKVDRKTMTRWLTGQTKHIHRDNLERLASLLGCTPHDLTQDENRLGAFATSVDQGIAARLIEQENLLEILAPTGKWPLLEELVKAAMQPDLPLALLGQLYNYLAIAAWRQSKLDQADEYTRQAISLGEQTGHKATIARAKLNEATVLSFRGRVKEAIGAYRYCVDNQQYLDELVRASALSNLGSVYWEFGEFTTSLRYQNEAIVCFEVLRKDLNLAIAWISKATTLFDMNLFVEAWQSVQTAQFHCERGRWARGFGDAYLVAAKILLAESDVAEARRFFNLAAERFATLGINEARTLAVGSMVLRAEGKLAEARAQLDVAEKMHPEFRIVQTEVLRAYLELAETMGDRILWEKKRDELRTLYLTCGCDGWSANLVKEAPF